MGMTQRQVAAAERKAARARIAQAQAETRAVVATGCCPDCGRKLRRNLSLTGWWQCSQYGSEQFRVEPAQPACSWQGFTE
jgi:ssDNA-binding Zn-finger/Zn-ribbon topoisomerase 1